MKSLLMFAILALTSQAHAWKVDCGSRSIYYANGTTLMTNGGTFYYPSGNTMITQAGSIYYASGLTFRTQGDTLYYQSGGTLKTQGGTYYHLNGTTARTQGGTFYRPDGGSTNIPFSFDIDFGSDVTGSVDIPAKGADSDINMVINVGRGEKLKLQVSPEGVSCSGLAGEKEVIVSGRAGKALLTIKSGVNEKSLIDAIQRALDSN